MNKQSVRLFAILAAAVAFVAFSVSAASVTPPQKTVNDFKITEKTVMAGQTYQNTTMIKGARERRESNLGMGMSMTHITQCDLKRTIQINDRARKYLITPIESGESDTADRPTATTVNAAPAQRGGVITYTTNVTDTGERKQMFGFTARHLKSTMSTEASPDACTQQTMRIERDGWYIDLNYEFSCNLDSPAQMTMGGPQGGGCRDRIRFKHTGRGKLGYAIQETTTMYGANGETTFTTTKEVLELSRQQLDAALFDIPAGYSEARSPQEMYGMPSSADVLNEVSDRQRPSTSVDSATETARGIRIGVVQINNKANASVSMDELRDRLVAEINGDGIEAIPLNALSLSEAQPEAKAKKCDFILVTDLATFKSPSTGKKLGGLLGRAAGVDSGGGKAEAKLDFKLYPTGNTTPSLSSSASAKEDTQDASLGAAVDREAQAVVAAARKP